MSTFLKLTDKYHTDSIQYVNPTYVRSLKEFEGGTRISFADGAPSPSTKRLTWSWTRFRTPREHPGAHSFEYLLHSQLSKKRERHCAPNCAKTLAK